MKENNLHIEAATRTVYIVRNTKTGAALLTTDDYQEAAKLVGMPVDIAEMMSEGSESAQADA